MRALQFFEENGQLSNTRLNCSLAVWTALFMAVYGTFVKEAAANPTLIFGLLAYGFGTKVLSKFAEVRNGNNKPAP